MIKIKTAPSIRRALTGRDVCVFTDDGAEIENILSVSIDQIDLNSVITATIEVLVSEIDIEAERILGLDEIKRAAKLHGFKVVPDA